jgi:BA14K-like protein
MIGTRIAVVRIAAVGIAVVFVAASIAMSAAQAQDYRVLRYGNTSPWSFDGRDDDRDYANNGNFPGNFSAQPSTAWLGVAGVIAGNSRRSPYPYPSQVVFGAPPQPPLCAQRYRSYDPSTGTWLGKDGLRHRCP